MILRRAELIALLACSGYVAIISAAVTSSRPLITNESLDLSSDTTNNSSVCWSDNVAYKDQDVVPGAGPCEQCTCNPPNVLCSMIKCEVKSGCKIIQKPNHCCPDYKCDCEYKGQKYNSGEIIDTPDMPCRVCYCKGGDVMCTSIECYKREDCEGKIVDGICCPKYDHCPPIDSSNPPNVKLTTTDVVLTRIGKHNSQPWLSTTDLAQALEPAADLTPPNSNQEIVYATGTTSSPEKIFTMVFQRFTSSVDGNATSTIDIPGEIETFNQSLATGILGDSDTSTSSYLSEDDITTDEVPGASAASEAVNTVRMTTTVLPIKLIEPNGLKSVTNYSEAPVNSSSSEIMLDGEYTLFTTVKLTDNENNTTSEEDEHEALVRYVEKGSNLSAILNIPVGNFTTNDPNSETSTKLDVLDWSTETAKVEIVSENIESVMPTNTISSTQVERFSSTSRPMQSTSSEGIIELTTIEESLSDEELMVDPGHMNISQLTSKATLNPSTPAVDLAVEEFKPSINDTSNRNLPSLQKVAATDQNTNSIATTQRPVNVIIKSGSTISTLFSDIITNSDMEAFTKSNDEEFYKSSQTIIMGSPSNLTTDVSLLRADSNINSDSSWKDDQIMTPTPRLNASTLAEQLSSSFTSSKGATDSTETTTIVSEISNSSEASTLTEVTADTEPYLNASNYNQSTAPHMDNANLDTYSNSTSPEPNLHLDNYSKFIAKRSIQSSSSTVAPLLTPTQNTILQVTNGITNQSQFPINTTTEDTGTSSTMKNESRQEPPAEAKVYNPLKPYPDEYPQEYQTIQDGPALIITRTTYTRIPNVTYTTVTMATLPTYRQMQKAEEGFASTLFDRKIRKRSYSDGHQATDNMEETSKKQFSST